MVIKSRNYFVFLNKFYNPLISVTMRANLFIHNMKFNGSKWFKFGSRNLHLIESTEF